MEFSSIQKAKVLLWNRMLPRYGCLKTKYYKKYFNWNKKQLYLYHLNIGYPIKHSVSEKNDWDIIFFCIFYLK